MKLISCDVENFGKINNAHFEFQDGCNVICEDNGWGKSTLAAFIRVMFFGFENANSRDDINNERRRFAPWQGGVYGGRIVFEANGSRYILSRTFGAKEKDDKFSLRDYETMLETDAFTENTGTELFKIDGKSFARSVYIAQNDCGTAVTDGINAKLGNLAENTDDINNFEKVDSKFKDLINKMNPSRKTGSLYRLKTEIAEMEQYVRQGQLVDKSIAETLKLRSDGQQHYSELKAMQEKLQLERAEISRSKDYLAAKEKYLGITREFNELSDKLTVMESYFHDDIPDMKTLQQHLDNITILRNNDNEIARCGLSESEKDKLHKYEALWGERVLDAESVNEYISRWNMRTDKKNTLSIRRDNLEFKRRMLQEQTKSGRNSIAMPVLLAGIILLLAGVSVLIAGRGEIFIQVIIGSFISVAGVAAVAAGALLQNNNRKKEHDTGGEEADLNREEEELNALEQLINEIESETKEFLASYSMEADEYGVLQALTGLKTDFEEYARLSDKSKEKELLVNDEEIKIIRREIDVFIRKYYNINSYDLNVFSELIYEIKLNLQRYNECLTEYERISRIKEAFEAENNIEELLNVPDDLDLTSIGELDRRVNSISADLERTHKSILDYNNRLEKLQSDRDLITDKEEELVELKSLMESEQEKYRLAIKAKELLGAAKISFTRKYMGPITNGFNKYYNILTGSQADNYFIDANGEVSVEELGTPKSKDYMSTGCKDLIGICMRMALIDSMYPQEKPFVIFDDPFVNLDNDRTQGGIDLLKTIGREYQVIYFTCHDSRIIR